MSKPAFTPGPYVYDPRNYDVDYSVGQSPEPAYIAARHPDGHWIRLAIIEPPQFWVQSEGRTDGLPGSLVRHGDEEANGHLFAAAPDLYEVASAIEDWWLSGEMVKHYGAPAFVFAARAALAKARGEAQ